MKKIVNINMFATMLLLIAQQVLCSPIRIDFDIDASGNATVPVEVDTLYQDGYSQASRHHDLPLKYTPALTYSTTSMSEHNLSNIDDILALSETNSSQHNHVKRAFFENGPNLVNFGGNLVKIRRNGAVEMAVLEAVQLALMGFYGVDANPSSFNRYFNELDKCTVREVFRRLIGDGRPAAIDFQRYRIYDGFPGDIDDPAPGQCGPPAKLAYTQKRLTSTAEDPQSQRGYLMICEAAWTRLGEDGHPLSRVTCDDLKGDASDVMVSLSYVILHEFLHWNNMFEPIAGPIVDFNSEMVAGVVPPDGYGPYNAQWLKSTGRVTTQNVDNYAWFAMETYFQWRCPDDEFRDVISADNVLDGRPWDV